MEILKEQEKVEVKYKYRKSETKQASAWVQYAAMDSKDELLGTTGMAGLGWHTGCFSSIFHSGLPVETKVFYIYHPLESIPYEEIEIMRWINDLTEVGLPCHYNGINGDHAIFQINLDEVKTKSQFCSIITLIRTLYEFPAIVPENYFKAMDDNPKADKVIEIQAAHKVKTGVTWPSMGHNITGNSWRYELTEHGSPDYQKPILLKSVDKETLFKNFERVGLTPFQAGRPELNSCWNEDYQDPYQAWAVKHA